MHHAMNHVRFMISPELHVVQDRVHGSPEPDVVQGALRIPHCDYRSLFPAMNSSSIVLACSSGNWIRGCFIA